MKNPLHPKMPARCASHLPPITRQRLPLLLLLPLLLPLSTAAQPAWTVNTQAYAYNMTMLAQLHLGGTADHASGNRIGVFVGDELRGMGNPVFNNGQAYYFLTIYANTVQGEKITFKAYIAASNTIDISPDTIVFKHNSHLGTVAAPQVLDFEPSEAPQIISLNEVTFQENTCFTLHDVETLDNEDAEGAGLAYSLDGGADAGKFLIGAGTGKLSWNNFTPDFENPGDANGDNRYEVKVKVTDLDGNTGRQTVLIRVTNNDDTPFSPQLTGSTVLCAGQTATLTASGGSAYLWSTGDNTASISNRPAGNYAVTVTNQFACSAVLAQTVLSNTVTAGALATDQTVCGAADPAAFTETQAATASGALSFYWQSGTTGCNGSFSNIPGATEAAFDPPANLPQTTYYRRVAVSTVNGAGCEATANCLTITRIVHDTQQPVALCKNAAVQLNAGGQANITAAEVNNNSYDNCSIGALNVTPNSFNNANVGANTVTLTVTDGNGNTATCTATVTVTPFQFTISGTVFWEHDDVTGVKDVTVVLSGNASGSAVTPLAGTYAFNNLMGSNFTITPGKTVNKLNGVTTADATAIQQHLAGNAPITDPYKLVAADVNKSNSVTAADATAINQALLGNPSALAQIKTSWRFVPTAHAMTNPPWGFPEAITISGAQGNQPNRNFFGIKTGDVAATYANPANLGAGDALTMYVQDQTLLPGTEITVNVLAGQFADLAALQFALRFDPAVLHFLELEPVAGSPLSADHFGLFNVGEGEVRAAWSQAQGLFLEESAALFRLKFAVLQGGGKLSGAFSLDGSSLECRAYTGLLAESAVELQFYQTNSTLPAGGTGEYRLLQNRPNPFGNTTTVGFMLAEAGEADIRILDVSGRLLAAHRAFFQAGNHEVIFDFTGRKISGLLYCELVTPRGKLVRKMVATAW